MHLEGKKSGWTIFRRSLNALLFSDGDNPVRCTARVDTGALSFSVFALTMTSVGQPRFRKMSLISLDLPLVQSNLSKRSKNIVRISLTQKSLEIYSRPRTAHLSIISASGLMRQWVGARTRRAATSTAMGTSAITGHLWIILQDNGLSFSII